MTKIIVIASQKGGTGKTATTQNLGYELSQQNQKTLLIDFDPQADLTKAFGFDLRELPVTIYDAMQNPKEASSMIQDGGSANLSLLPSSLDLAGAELKLGSQVFVDRNSWLSRVTRQLVGKQDLILIDCPPSLGFYTANAFYAADEVIVPLQCEFLAYDALDQLFEVIQLVQEQRDGLPFISGIVLTMYDKRISLTAEVEAAARERFGDLVFQTVIPRNVSVSEAAIGGKPVAEYKANSSGALAYKALAKEVMERG